VSERTIGFIDVRKGHKEALLVATDQRFILAWTWRPPLFLDWLPYILFGRLALFLRLLPARKASELEKLTPDEILKDDKRNFAIPFSEIVEVKIRGFLTKNIVVATHETEYRFTFRRKTELYYFEDQVCPHLADKVPIRRN
jgi:hypothetical protein